MDALTTPLPSLLAALFARRGSTIRYDLATMRAILEFPEFQRIRGRDALIVGTNGKGSTTALLHAALRHEGHNSARFTSPHLERFEERIVLGDDEIGEEVVRAGLVALERIEPSLPRPFSFFEGTLAMATFATQRACSDTVVWEAGLGGRLDATNALSSEHLAVIGVTSIGLDHQAILGSDVEHIAREKAGVFRPNVPIVSAPQSLPVARVLQSCARAVGAPFTLLREGECVERARGLPDGPQYQRRNAALADALGETLHTAGLRCSPAARQRARECFAWPGRYEWVTSERAQTRCAWLLDGAHNVPATLALADAITRDARLSSKRLRLLFTALIDKDIGALLAPLQPLVSEVHVTPVEGTRSRAQDDLAHLPRVSIAHGNVTRAIDVLAATSRDDDVIVVTGSLMLIGEVKTALRTRGTNRA